MQGANKMMTQEEKIDDAKRRLQELKDEYVAAKDWKKKSIMMLIKGFEGAIKKMEQQQ